MLFTKDVPTFTITDPLLEPPTGDPLLEVSGVGFLEIGGVIFGDPDGVTLRKWAGVVLLDRSPSRLKI